MIPEAPRSGAADTEDGDVLALHFDYVDPASYLLHLRLERILPADAPLRCHGFEIRPPPAPLVDPGDERWITYMTAMGEAAAALGASLSPPEVLPWSRKAHELALHAAEKGCFAPVHRALFDAHFASGRDIGRVDVLVELAASHSLDPTEAKAVLDVDRQRERVEGMREWAERRGIRGVPTLRWREHCIEGYPDADTLAAFLIRAGSSPRGEAGQGAPDTDAANDSGPGRRGTGEG